MYNKYYGTRKTPQAMPIPSQAHKMAMNNAGGYSYVIKDWERLNRFLILGSAGGTYYVAPRELTVQNAGAVQNCIRENGPRAVDEIVGVSLAGKAASNDPALFVLAMACAAADDNTRQYALEALPQVARIGTHLLHFCAYADAMRGWGRGLTRAVGDWFNAMPTDKLAYQVAKYQSRDGWSMRDVLRVAHPKTTDSVRNSIYAWVTHGTPTEQKLLAAMDTVKATTDERAIIRAIRNVGLTREMVPTNWLNSVPVWEALLEKMPLEALVRNLGKISALGIVDKSIAEHITSAEYIHKSRLHPIKLLYALRTYSQGHGMKGGLTWTVDREIEQALDTAFYLAFDNIPYLSGRAMLSLDISGSMSSPIGGAPIMSSEVCAAFAMVLLRRAENCVIRGFGTELRELDITREMKLADVMRKTSGLTFGDTDCSAPMIWARRNHEKFDAFVCFTDGETWAGGEHPSQALEHYRASSGIAARQVFCATTATNFSLADPDDMNSLDIAGFGADVPNLIYSFIGGNAEEGTDE